MAGNNSIQILRGNLPINSTQKNAIIDTLLPGQPLHDINKGYLYIGNTGKEPITTNRIVSYGTGLFGIVGQNGEVAFDDNGELSIKSNDIGINSTQNVNIAAQGGNKSITIDTTGININGGSATSSGNINISAGIGKIYLRGITHVASTLNVGENNIQSIAANPISFTAFSRNATDMSVQSSIEMNENAISLNTNGNLDINANSELSIKSNNVNINSTQINIANYIKTDISLGTVAIGNNATANGNYSTALGSGATANNTKAPER